jgi:transcriptional regulator with XRE-family HTH domain
MQQSKVSFLKKIREDLGYSQELASKKIGVSIGTLRQWEQNKCLPSLKHLPAIVNAYYIPYENVVLGCLKSIKN